MSKVEIKALSPSEAPVQIIKPEFIRRMKEMQMMQGMGSELFPEQYNVIINGNHPVIADKLLKAEDNRKSEIATQLYRLALLQQGMLTGAELADFVKKSVERV